MSEEYKKTVFFEEWHENRNRYFTMLAVIVIAFYFVATMIVLSMNFEMNITLFGVPLLIIGICIVILLIVLQIWTDRPPVLTEPESIIE
ncbi:MAG: hypothetical protein ACFFED_09030 [Candidatus Thorarchaeota archaeon]